MYALAISVDNFGSSPNVPLTLFHLGSVAISTCGESAVAIPNARYSIAAICPKFFTTAGSNVAAKPSEPGHIEILPPAPALNSALAIVPCLGSELLFAGIPIPILSANACTLLFHMAATSGL